MQSEGEIQREFGTPSKAVIRMTIFLSPRSSTDFLHDLATLAGFYTHNHTEEDVKRYLVILTDDIMHANIYAMKVSPTVL